MSSILTHGAIIETYSSRKATRGFIHEVCFYNGGSNGLRVCFASILSRRVRFPRSPPNNGSVVQSGRTLVSKTKCRRFKSFPGRQLCSGGREAQCSGLQIRKTVSSNLTRYSKYSRIVKWYNNRLITGHYKFDSCSGNQVYFKRRMT